MINKNFRRTRLISIIVFLLLIALLIYYFFYRHSKLLTVQQAVQKVSRCDLKPVTDSKVKAEFDSVLSLVRAEIRGYGAGDVPGVFNPFGRCIIDSSGCRYQFRRLAMYVEGRQINIRLFDCDDVDGYVHLQSEYEISLSRRLLDNEAQLRRTIVHELAHLANPNEHHDFSKTDCSYFKSVPIKCEYCLTGTANLSAMDTLRTFLFTNTYQTKDVCFILAK